MSAVTVIGPTILVTLVLDAPPLVGDVIELGEALWRVTERRHVRGLSGEMRLAVIVERVSAGGAA